MRVDDSAGHGVLEAADLPSEDPRVHTLARVDVHKLAGLGDAAGGKGCLNLLDFRHTNSLNLSLADSVAVEDYPRWKGAVVLLEGFEGTHHARLKVVGSLLPDFVLSHAHRPVGGSRLIHRGGEGQYRLLAEGGGMEHIHATDHCRNRHERQAVDGPWHSTYLGIHLDQNLGDDRSQILAALDSAGQNDLGRDGVLLEEEPLDIVIEGAPRFGSWEDEHHHLDSIIQLRLESLLPGVEAHARLDRNHVGFGTFVAASLETLGHGLLERACYLLVPIPGEDAPRLESGLGEHLALDFAVNVAHVLLDVERVWTATSRRSHEEFPSRILESVEFRWVLVELQVPQLLFLHTLRVGLEVRHEVLDFLNLGLGIRVQYHSKVLHQAEVRTHRISEARQLAELWDERHLVSGPTIFVDQEWLVSIGNVLIIAGLVVLSVACRSPILVERGLGTLREVYSVDFVSLLVVPGNNRATFESLRDHLLSVLVPLLGLVAQVIQVGEGAISTYYFKADVDVEQHPSLLHDQARVKAGPHLDVVCVETVRVCLVEALLADLFESEGAHHRVEEYLQEVHVVAISLLHDLDPLDGDGVLLPLMLSLIDGQLGDFLQAEDT